MRNCPNTRIQGKTTNDKRSRVRQLTLQVVIQLSINSSGDCRYFVYLSFCESRRVGNDVNLNFNLSKVILTVAFRKQTHSCDLFDEIIMGGLGFTKRLQCNFVKLIWQQRCILQYFSYFWIPSEITTEVEKWSEKIRFVTQKIFIYSRIYLTMTSEILETERSRFEGFVSVFFLNKICSARNR